jgi:hypothetical protein
MSDPRIEQIISSAVGAAFDAWAVEHPGLAAAIDRLNFSDSVVESLRKSPQYRQALEEYRKSNLELDLLNRLVELAGPIVTALLAK